MTADLLAALSDAAAAPDEPCPNFAQGDAGRTGWWPRHQAHEALVHLWDLESVTGGFAPRDPAIAADGVSELFATYTNRYPRQRLSRPIRLRAPGVGAWRVEPRGPGLVQGLPVDDAGPADLTAAPEVLLLALWHRIPTDDPRLEYADGAAVDVRAFLAGPLTA